MKNTAPTASDLPAAPADTPRVPPLAPWISLEARRAFDGLLREVIPPFATIEQTRAFYDGENRKRLKVMRELFAVETAPRQIAGVPVDLVVPAGRALELEPGAPMLLCLHGGGFGWGAGAGALLEAVPIAAVSGLPVVAVDYRMAPEHRYPAATDDVVAVYRALLADRPAAAIGLFGCSAGAILTAQVLARLQAAGEPRPGATAMMHASGIELAGDLLVMAPALTSQTTVTASSRLIDLPYFEGADAGDPMVFPSEHPQVLAAFPPSLLMTSTRDFAASSVAMMHRRLRAAGAEAELFVFDGLWHAFHMWGELPESQELYARVAEFFLARLPRSGA
ncbi:alpha/beta hydrolase fold domain-containing protein [Pelomonas sp. KK5]|uniref:alpha/beta hydrolase fold domain-containing protein n=1 Tax=Pelomonas sp. KK5 TaxID=1855730 RepID=UPI001301E388|nr:alpha/beta hydrolase fold domain-containing protein [Pelomonas sp. KK5]